MIRLPQALDKASQSINTKTIKIEHVLVVKAVFRSGDGNEGSAVEVFCFPLHLFLRGLDFAKGVKLISAQITESVPFSIYMTPSTIGSDALVRGKVLQDCSNPPPAYGDHISSPRLLEADLESVLGNQSHVLRALESGTCREVFADVEPPLYASLGVVS